MSLQEYPVPTDHTHTGLTHGIAVGYEWIHIMRWSRVPACCQTAAVTKLCVHRGCQPGCLNTSSLVCSSGGGHSMEKAPSILDSVQLRIRIERQRAAGLGCKQRRVSRAARNEVAMGPALWRVKWFSFRWGKVWTWCIFIEDKKKIARNGWMCWDPFCQTQGSLLHDAYILAHYH